MKLCKAQIGREMLAITADDDHASRYGIDGIHVEQISDEQSRTVATNGRTLAIVDYRHGELNGQVGNFIVGYDSAKQLAKMLPRKKTDDSDVRITGSDVHRISDGAKAEIDRLNDESKTEYQIDWTNPLCKALEQQTVRAQIIGAGCLAELALVDGRYPDYARVMPGDMDGQITVRLNSAMLVDLLKAAMQVTKDNDGSGDIILLTVRDNETAVEIAAESEATEDGKPVKTFRAIQMPISMSTD